MKPLHLAQILLLGGFVLAAEPITSPADVSHERLQLLNPQDKLFFTVSDWSYYIHAAATAMSPYPSHVTFQFISTLESGAGDFAAWFESVDGSVAAPFPGTFCWFPALYQSFGYTGPVSVLYGSMDLPSGLAAELFGGTSAVLVLENNGGPVDVGLPSYRLWQDLSVSFSSGGLGVSGPVTDVKYQDPPPTVPEPDYRWFLLLLGGILWLVPRAANRIRCERI